MALPQALESFACARCPTCVLLHWEHPARGRTGRSCAVVSPSSLCCQAEMPLAQCVCQSSLGLSQSLWHNKGASVVSRGTRHRRVLSLSETLPFLSSTWRSQFPARSRGSGCPADGLQVPTPRAQCLHTHCAVGLQHRE